MEVTGYQLMRALKELAFAKETAEHIFDDSIWKFEDEEKPSPVAAMSIFREAEANFAQVQAAQALYNQKVKVSVGGQDISLTMAIKLVGGAGRVEKKWRDLSKPKKMDRYDFGESLKRSREEGTEYAEKQITVTDSQLLAKTAARRASALREAIQIGNGTKVEIEGLEPALLE